jgi:hypothetical protein
MVAPTSAGTDTQRQTARPSLLPELAPRGVIDGAAAANRAIRANPLQRWSPQLPTNRRFGSERDGGVRGAAQGLNGLAVLYAMRFESPVVVDPMRICELLVGLPNVSDL